MQDGAWHRCRMMDMNSAPLCRLLLGSSSVRPQGFKRDPESCWCLVAILQCRTCMQLSGEMHLQPVSQLLKASFRRLLVPGGAAVAA